MVSQLYAGNGAALGVDIEAEDCLTAAVDAAQLGVFDVLSVKLSAIKLATDAAVTVLRVDQVRSDDFLLIFSRSSCRSLLVAPKLPKVATLMMKTISFLHKLINMIPLFLFFLAIISVVA